MATTTEPDGVSRTSAVPSRERVPWWALAVILMIGLGWALHFLFNSGATRSYGAAPPVGADSAPAR